jgi:bifunctional DNA-binding transcriptional regulator/antitoxin component of YhaV-PrlF toxin-antitoxin module
MSHKIIEVVYTTKSQSAPGRFTVPAEVCEALRIGAGSDVEIEVNAKGSWHGPVVKQLVSDREPSPVGKMREWMDAGEEITVRVRRA